MKQITTVFCLCLLCWFGGLMPAFAQEIKEVAVDSEPIQAVEKYPQFTFKGLFQARYLSSMHTNVDVNGVHHLDDKALTNTFDLKRMRFAVTAKIGPHTEVVTLVNLADFKSDPKQKVLENAYLKYTLNPYLAITVGQFRPLFGIEENYPVDVVKSIDYSNQYYEFGKNGWASFQVGAAVSGKVDLGKVPMNYAVSVMNGNGKNQMDKDNGKHYSTRLAFDVSKKHAVTLGLSGGIGEVFEQGVYAIGVDATAQWQWSDRWCLDVQMEAKQGTNHQLYFASKPEALLGSLDNYKVHGFYVLPNIRYALRSPKLNSLEFSCRYEYLDVNASLDSNARHTVIPMLSLEILKDYKARIQLGMQIDAFKHNRENSSAYDANLAFIQIQTRL